MIFDLQWKYRINKLPENFQVYEWNEVINLMFSEIL